MGEGAFVHRLRGDAALLDGWTTPILTGAGEKAGYLPPCWYRWHETM